MHVIIGGFGRVGRYVARVLESEGHTITVIDRSAEVFAQHGEGIRGRMLTGEVFDRDTLVKAGVEHADAYVAVTSGDNSNVVSARVAKERFGVPRVIARIYDPGRAALYERFGIDTVSSVQWASAQLAAMLLEPDFRVSSIYGAGEVVTVSVEAPLTMTGKRVSDLEYPGKFTLSALVREGQAILPSPRLEIVKGDTLYITTTRDSLSELKRLLGMDGGAY